MRRGNGEGSIYQRGDGRWAGAVYVYNREGGRQRRQVYGRTRAEAAGKVSDLISRNREHRPAAAVRITVEQFGLAWVARLGMSGLKPATVSNYGWVLQRYVYPEVGHVRLVALTPQHVRDLLHSTGERGVSPRTVQLTRAVLRSLLADAEREELVHRNVAGLVKGRGLSDRRWCRGPWIRPCAFSPRCVSIGSGRCSPSEWP